MAIFWALLSRSNNIHSKLKKNPRGKPSGLRPLGFSTRIFLSFVVTIIGSASQTSAYCSIFATHSFTLQGSTNSQRRIMGVSDEKGRATFYFSLSIHLTETVAAVANFPCHLIVVPLHKKGIHAHLEFVTTFIFSNKNTVFCKQHFYKPWRLTNLRSPYSFALRQELIEDA